jgi:hypothetical protein
MNTLADRLTITSLVTCEQNVDYKHAGLAHFA